MRYPACFLAILPIVLHNMDPLRLAAEDRRLTMNPGAKVIGGVGCCVAPISTILAQAWLRHTCQQPQYCRFLSVVVIKYSDKNYLRRGQVYF